MLKHWKRCVLCAVLAVAASLVSLAHSQTSGDISLNFNNEMVLANAVRDIEFEVTDEFQSAVSSAVNTAAGTGTSIATTVYSAPPNLIVVSSAWATGTVSDVETEIARLNDTYATWRDSPSSAIYTSLNGLCLNNIGRQPAVIDVTDTCSYYDAPVAPTPIDACNRSLSFTFLSPQAAATQANATKLQQVLCQILDTDCGLISCATTGSETITMSQETLVPAEILSPLVNTYTVMTCSVYAEDRNAALVTLVSFASYASVLSSQRIAYIRMNGVQIYYEGQEPRLQYEGTTGQCLSHYWYLIFFIILVPVILIAGQRIYLWGRRSGKKSIRDYEKDIRAGVHLSANPWGAYGGGGGGMQMPPPGYGPPGYGGGPQYGPQAGGGMVMPQQQGGFPSMRGMGGAGGGGAGGAYSMMQDPSWGDGTGYQFGPRGGAGAGGGGGSGNPQQRNNFSPQQSWSPQLPQRQLQQQQQQQQYTMGNMQQNQNWYQGN